MRCGLEDDFWEGVSLGVGVEVEWESKRTKEVGAKVVIQGRAVVVVRTVVVWEGRGRALVVNRAPFHVGTRW